MMKFYHSGMGGAPAMTGTVGATIGVLDACLKDGFGLKSVTSLVVSGGVATATVGTGHPGVVNGTVLIAGSSITALNGEQTVTSVTSTTVSWATSAADGTATGTITLKAAPLGWTKSFTGTNLAAYKPSAVAATGCYLRVDDTSAQVTRVVGYETMTDVNTGTNAFPTAVQFSGGLYWPKSSTADTAARPWFVVGDDRIFYIYVSPNAGFSGQGAMFGFGDILSNKPGDAWHCALFGSEAAGVNNYGSQNPGDVGCAAQVGGAATGFYLARAVAALPGAQAALKLSAHIQTAAQSGAANSGNLAFPDPDNNGLLVGPVDVRAGTGLRGRLPGILHSPQYIFDAISTLTVFDGAGVYAGKKLMAIRTGLTGNAGNTGPLFVDLTGPWR